MNALYDKARKRLLEANVNVVTDTIKATAVRVSSGGYAVNLATDDVIASVASGTRVATVTLASASTASGAFDAADTVLTAPSGAIEALVIWKDTGAEATSPLLAYIDSAAGMPLVADGTDVPIVWDNGVNKIFRP